MARRGALAGTMPGGFQRIPGYREPKSDGAAYQRRVDAEGRIREILSRYEGGKRTLLAAEVSKMRREGVGSERIAEILTQADTVARDGR